MSTTLTCELCGHQWIPFALTERKTKARVAKSIVAAKVNQQGPFCELCRSLEMATRAAEARGLTFTQGVDLWLEQGAKWLEKREKNEAG